MGAEPYPEFYEYPDPEQWVGAVSEFVAHGNGGTHSNPKDGYSRCLIPGYRTTQQAAATWGVVQGTARDIVSGRKRRRRGVLVKGQWVISLNEIVAVLVERESGT